MKLALVWPRMPDRVLVSTPLASAWVAKVCLRSWKRRSGRTMVRVPVQVLVSPVTRYPPFSFERPDFSGLAGFSPPFRSAVTPELIQTDHLSPPLPKAHNPVHRPALRDGVISGRGGRFGHTDRTPRLANWAGRVRYPHFHRRTQRITSRCLTEQIFVVDGSLQKEGNRSFDRSPSHHMSQSSSAVAMIIRICLPVLLLELLYQPVRV